MDLVELRQRCLTARTNGFIIAYGDRIADELESKLAVKEETTMLRGSPEHLLSLLDQLSRTPVRPPIVVSEPAPSGTASGSFVPEVQPVTEVQPVVEPVPEVQPVAEVVQAEPVVEPAPEPSAVEPPPETAKERRGGRKSAKE